MGGIHVARQGFVTKAALPSLARQRGPVAYACSLLINGNGPNNATNPQVPSDVSGNKAFARALNPFPVSATPYSSGGSVYNTGTNRVAFYTTPVQITTGEFCIEFWCYPENFSAARPIVSSRAWSTGNNKGWEITHSTTGKVLLSASQGVWNSWPTIITSTTSLTANAWNHVVIERDSSGVLKMFFNGVQDATSLTYTQSLDQFNGTFGNHYFTVLNGYGDGQFNATPFNGYIGDVRIGTGAGSAIYTANFTPPTSSLTSTTGTVLCLRATAYVTDSGPNNVVMTPWGSVVQVDASPFGSAYFGSLSFTGATSSYVATAAANSADFAFGTGDFTIEGWVQARDFTGDRYIYDSRSGGSGAYPTLFLNASGVLVYHTQNADRISSTPLSTNTWYHVAVSRSGTSTKMFVNGVQAGSTWTDTTTYLNNSTRPVIGVSGLNTALNSLNGSISNLRVVKGTALYTTGFTPSTTPLTAVSGTTLLLANNVGIGDGSANSYNVGLFGNAKISTAQSKFGGSSVLLDGTGDYLTVPNATPLQFSVALFQFECWVYRNASGVVHTIAAKGTASTGWLLQINASDKLVWTINTSTVLMTSTSSIPANTWAHVAVTRDGTNVMRMFINGTQEATVTNSTTYTQTNELVIGADRSYANFFNGYIEDVRIFRDGAKYLAAFTAPTTELPATDNCYRYFTNAVYGVYQLA